MPSSCLHLAFILLFTVFLLENAVSQEARYCYEGLDCTGLYWVKKSILCVLVVVENNIYFFRHLGRLCIAATAKMRWVVSVFLTLTLVIATTVT